MSIDKINIDFINHCTDSDIRDIAKFIESNRFKTYGDISFCHNDSGTALMACAYTNRADVIEFLFNRPEFANKIDIHQTQGDGLNALMFAVQGGAFNAIETLLFSKKIKEHANIHHLNHYHKNVLLMAAQHQYNDIVKLLLDDERIIKKPNIYCEDQSNNNIFIYACRNKNIDLVDYLLFKHHYVISKNIENKLLFYKNNSDDFIDDVIHKIKSRDLHDKLNQNLTHKEKIVRQKI